MQQVNNEEEVQEVDVQEDDVQEEDSCLKGVAGEVKRTGRSPTEERADKKQLLSNMEKVAGDFALMAGKKGERFQKYTSMDYYLTLRGVP